MANRRDRKFESIHMILGLIAVGASVMFFLTLCTPKKIVEIPDTLPTAEEILWPRVAVGQPKQAYKLGPGMSMGTMKVHEINPKQIMFEYQNTRFPSGQMGYFEAERRSSCTMGETRCEKDAYVGEMNNPPPFGMWPFCMCGRFLKGDHWYGLFRGHTKTQDGITWLTMGIEKSILGEQLEKGEPEYADAVDMELKKQIKLLEKP